MVDAAGAVAALAAAGDQAESLKAAILAASFLDEVPGEDRQKLRGEPATAACCTTCACIDCRMFAVVEHHAHGPLPHTRMRSRPDAAAQAAGSTRRGGFAGRRRGWRRARQRGRALAAHQGEL